MISLWTFGHMFQSVLVYINVLVKHSLWLTETPLHSLQISVRWKTRASSKSQWLNGVFVIWPYRSRSRSRSDRRYKSSRHSRSDSRSPSSRRSHSHSPMSSRRRHMGTREHPKPSRCLGVFGLSVHTTEDELYHIFNKYGPVERVQVVIDAKVREWSNYFLEQKQVVRYFWQVTKIT